MTMLDYWMRFNAVTKEWEFGNVDPADCRPGTRVLRLFWSGQAARFVTIPGASEYVVNDKHQLVQKEQ